MRASWSGTSRYAITTRPFACTTPVATEEMTLRDLVTHRSGLPRHDLVWYTQDISREEVIERLRCSWSRTNPSPQYLSVQQPDVHDGRLSGRANLRWNLGTGGAEASARRGMRMPGTNFSVGASTKSPDFAQPYRKDRKTQLVYKIPFYIQAQLVRRERSDSNADVSRAT